MRHFVLIITLVFLASCSAYKIDMREANNCPSGYLLALQQSDFDKASTYYSDMFNETESPERRIEKMQKLEEAMGKIISYELTDSVLQKNTGEIPTVLFTYKVKHTEVIATYKFNIMKDAGKYRIISQYVETDN